MWTLLLLTALVGADEATNPCGEPADIPMPTYHAVFPKESKPPLKLVHHLLDPFSAGEGLFQRFGDVSTRREDNEDLPENIVLRELPWNVHPERRERAQLVTWKADEFFLEGESSLGFVLETGESWCSPDIDIEAGGRLRFEALELDRQGSSRYRVSLKNTKNEQTLIETDPTPPTGLNADFQVDLELDEQTGQVCFEVDEGRVAFGEPRLLAPEHPGEDARPRWVVLIIMDGLRGDTLLRKSADELSPSLMSLARSGRHFTKAISPGCHTRAAVWPLMMGRDLMRVDPLKRRRYAPRSSPYSKVYSRGNIFVTHLAENAGYHSVFLGNNEYFRRLPAFSRYSNHGETDTGTVDTVARLPDLLRRYADERLFLMYYIANPHWRSGTPSRLYEKFGCGKLSTADRCRCMYDVRIRHADESLAAFEEALTDYGLMEDTLQILTADHGELLGEGMDLEAESPSLIDGIKLGVWDPLDWSHGTTCHWGEIHVPLVLAGKGMQPSRWDDPVSTLDIVPTLSQALGLPAWNRMDGEVLPLTESGESLGETRRFVSYGFCTDSAIEGDRQLIWWAQDCRVREKQSKEILDYKSELWDTSSRLETDRSRPDLIRKELLKHEQWIESRLPSTALILDLSNLPPGRLQVKCLSGRIRDYGPSGTVYGLQGIQDVALEDGGETLSISHNGFRGLFYVETAPDWATIRIDLDQTEEQSKLKPLTFTGPMQLPLELLGQTIDAGAHKSLYRSNDTPPRRESPLPNLRIWWQPYYEGSIPLPNREELSDFDRVLRDWGYIR